MFWYILTHFITVASESQHCETAQIFFYCGSNFFLGWTSATFVVTAFLELRSGDDRASILNILAKILHHCGIYRQTVLTEWEILRF